jgi:tetratricopeptide (TPR) repeat protein
MLLDQLNDLETAGLIRLVQMDPELEYLFRHALVQEAAYESMLKEDRRLLHQRVGETLEALYPDQVGELAATLAHHFGLAEDAPRALRYRVRAADAALERYAVVEAINHYTRALETAKQIGPAAEAPWLRLYRNLGRALELDSRYARAVEIYKEMAAAARARGDRAMELAALTEHAKVHATPSAAHDAVQGQALAEQALAVARELGDRAAEARIEWVMLIVNWIQGNSAGGLIHGERSLALAREMNLREQLAYTLQDMHRSRMNVGNLEGAKSALEEARALWRELNNLPLLADNLASTADLLHTLGEYDLALVFAQEAWQLSRSIGNLWNQAFARGMVGEIHQSRGEFGPALAALQEAREISARAGPVIMYLRVCRDLAQAYREIGALDGARQILQAGLEEERLEAPMRESFWIDGLLIQAQVEVCAGRIDRAMALLEEVRAQPEAAQRRPVTVAAVHAEVALGQGEYAQALDVLDAFLETMGADLALPLRPRLHLLKGQALLGLGRLGEAVSLLRGAAEEARGLGLRPRLWPILMTLGRCESLGRNAAAAAAAFGEARQVVEEIAASIDQAGLRTSFLGRPDVRALLETR